MTLRNNPITISLVLLVGAGRFHHGLRGSDNTKRGEMVMTDEERQKLVADLREFTGLDNEPWLVRVGRQAANEIERLAALAQSDADPDYKEAWIKAQNRIEKLEAALAQSDAEPVAWRWRFPRHHEWKVTFSKASADYRRSECCEVEPLFTASPRPDASVGMSWSGFNVYGNKKSIDAVRDALHAKDRCEALDKMIAAKQLVRPDAPAELQERSLENNMLAFQWMERHDKIVGFISKNYPSVMLPNLPFPSPASRPDASAGLIEAAEWHEQQAEEFRIEAEQAGEPSPSPQVVTHLASAYEFRRWVARAVDRSTK